MSDPSIADAAAALLAKVPDSPEARALRDVAIGKDAWQVTIGGAALSVGGRPIELDRSTAITIAAMLTPWVGGATADLTPSSPTQVAAVKAADAMAEAKHQAEREAQDAQAEAEGGKAAADMKAHADAMAASEALRQETAAAEQLKQEATIRELAAAQAKVDPAPAKLGARRRPPPP